MILLDTNVISALMQRQPDPVVVAWLNAQSPQQIWLPSLEQLIEGRIAPLDGQAAQQAAQLAAWRQAKGTSVDLRDTLIALARGAMLATRNHRHFNDTTIGLINPFAGPAASH